MDADEVDRRVRAAAFDFLVRQTSVHGDALPLEVLRRGFDLDGQRVPLVGPQGIFKPAAIRTGMPLSITTVPTVPGKPRPYDDEVTADGLIRYRYRKTGLHHRDNVGLRNAMATQTPLVYFHGLEPGRYSAHWPAFIVADDPSSQGFTVAVDDPAALRPDLSPAVVDEAQRRYVTRLTRHRIHQLKFRTHVLRAYRQSCSICRLRHPELLDAAHIVADSHVLGEPVVSNGLSLCKLHHSAFDKNVLGIRPDLVVEIRRDVLDEIDGPMLQHGLKDFSGSRLLVVPTRQEQKPDAALLEVRYDEFRRTG